MPNYSAEILIVGSEHLLGLSLDTNSLLLCKRLADLGISVYRKTVVGDNLGRLTEAFREALLRSDLAIAVGGLGPTDDDVTREALADAAGVSLRINTDVQKEIAAKFARRQRKPLPNAFRQALVPEGSEWLPNSSGTAPGLYHRLGGKALAALPGPPQEFESVLREQLLPRLARDFPSMQVIVSREIHCCGIPESEAMSRLATLAGCENPTIAPLANWGLLTIRITARADNTEAASGLCKPVEQQVVQALGDCVFGYDQETLESAVLRELRARNQTISCAESMTGGEICKMLSSAPGSSAVFLGGVVVYTRAAKKALLGFTEDQLARSGTVGQEITGRLAQEIQRRLNSTYALAVTGEAGPVVLETAYSVGDYFVAVAGPVGIAVRHPVAIGDRTSIRKIASVTALSILYRSLIGNG